MINLYEKNHVPEQGFEPTSPQITQILNGFMPKLIRIATILHVDIPYARHYNPLLIRNRS